MMNFLLAQVTLAQIMATDFLPHGWCMRWKADVIWLHVISDGLIAAAYFCIPLTLVHLARKRKDFPFPWMLWLFGLFIVSCGTTHLMAIWTLWQPVYQLDGMIKALTALSSVPTAAILVWLLPRALALPSPDQLRLEVEERRRAESQIRYLNNELEVRVAERTQRLRRSNEALQRIAYIASHDLQEPIRMVVCYNQLIERTLLNKLDESEKEYIHYSVQGSRRMQALVADLQALAENLNREPVTRKQPVDLDPLVTAARDDLRLMMEETNAKLECEHLPPVLGEPVELKQVFQNLISNALKYRREGVPPLIVIRGKVRGDDVLISVTDNGIGIDPKFSDYIFEPFKRLHGSDYPGSGIGLALCRNVIEDHGGKIWFESREGGGTTFYFTLPLAESVVRRSQR